MGYASGVDSTSGDRRDEALHGKGRRASLGRRVPSAPTRTRAAARTWRGDPGDRRAPQGPMEVAGPRQARWRKDRLLLARNDGSHPDAIHVPEIRAFRPDCETARGITQGDRKRVSMKKQLFDELLASVREGGAILRGDQPASREFHFDEPDVRGLRQRYGLSQPKFAALLGISVATLRNWEQGRRKPEGSARILLRIVSLHPGAVLDVARLYTSDRSG